ncbi:hypothetical protein BRM9_1679 [Methanobacterium formicicum]|uniref:Uncharacterized protein n=1 Tax=Methanobacterium formicicum TaxID=2162 RepID=A0A089ZH12_METFO|nr:hypothetical protein [Methanobacterium formicicum]AIS32490.1 hypothetical protein BRM9_1679 [Methanobacterium formicicum]
MSGQIERNPIKWHVKGNIAPQEVSNPTNEGVFTKNNCTLIVESAVVIDGNLIKPIKSTPNF